MVTESIESSPVREPRVHVVLARDEWDQQPEDILIALAAPVEGARVRWTVQRSAATSEPLDPRGATVTALIALANRRLLPVAVIADGAQQCRDCGCLGDDDFTCDEGCRWVAADLCSACAPRGER